MTTPARRRLMRDFKFLQKDPPMGIQGSPQDNNIMVWDAVIYGPADTPFEDGTFKLQISFSEEYPNKPPKVKFISKMFHPNVYNDGSLCLDILQNRWSPSYDVSSILTSIQSLLDEPNPSSPANAEAAKLFQENRCEYEKRIQKIVESSWMDFDDLSSESSSSDHEDMKVTSQEGDERAMEGATNTGNSNTDTVNDTNQINSQNHTNTSTSTSNDLNINIFQNTNSTINNSSNNTISNVSENNIRDNYTLDMNDIDVDPTIQETSTNTNSSMEINTRLNYIYDNVDHISSNTDTTPNVSMQNSQEDLDSMEE